jgi:hypothetical protein
LNTGSARSTALCRLRGWVIVEVDPLMRAVAERLAPRRPTPAEGEGRLGWHDHVPVLILQHDVSHDQSLSIPSDDEFDLSHLVLLSTAQSHIIADFGP